MEGRWQAYFRTALECLSVPLLTSAEGTSDLVDTPEKAVMRTAGSSWISPRLYSRTPFSI
jgi:hypothetical protein